MGMGPVAASCGHWCIDMARSRNIKPGFFTNEDLVELDFATRLLFAGLWTVADRDGRLQDRPKKIKIDIFPADNLDIDAMLQALHTSKFIVRYEIDGSKFIQISNWTKHQNPHHTEKASEIPGFNAVLTVKPPLDNKQPKEQDGECLADSLLLIPDSLIPDSLVGEPQAKPANRATRKCPADFELTASMLTWADEECPGVNLDRATKKFMDHTFKTAMTDWPATWRNWIRSDFERLPAKTNSSETTYQRSMRMRYEEATGTSQTRSVIDITPTNTLELAS